MARKLTQKEFEDKVKISSPNLIIKGNFINTRNRIKVQCKDCNFEWNPKATEVLAGNPKNHICPNCNKLSAVCKSDLYELLDKESSEIFPLFLKEYDNEIIKSKEDILIYDGRCKHYWNITYNRIQKQGVKCPFCANKKVWKGFNDIATTDPWMIELMVNKEDAYKYTKGSAKKINWQCQKCKKIYNKTIVDVWEHGLSCTKCSDGRSYPERLMSNLLDELGIDFVPQFVIDGYSYIYDFYIPSLKCIIETHGNQHYDNHGFGMIHRERTRSLEEEQENDRLKEELAKSFGLTYIVIDCRNSDYNFIKESILKTNFCNILNVNIDNVDFKSLHIKSVQSSYLKICELYNKGISIEDIVKCVHLSDNTVKKHLRDGTKNGICNYNGIEFVKKSLKILNDKNKKIVRCITTNKIFDSILSGASFYGIHKNQLSRHLNHPDKNFFAGYSKETGEKLIWEFI